MRERLGWTALSVVIAIAAAGCDSRCEKEAQAVVRALCAESVAALSTPEATESCVGAERVRFVAKTCREPRGPAFEAWETCVDAAADRCWEEVGGDTNEGWLPCHDAAARSCAEQAQPRIRDWHACRLSAGASWEEPAARERCGVWDREAAISRCVAEAPAWVHYDEMIERCDAGGRIAREDASWWLPGATRHP